MRMTFTLSFHYLTMLVKPIFTKMPKIVFKKLSEAIRRSDVCIYDAPQLRVVFRIKRRLPGRYNLSPFLLHLNVTSLQIVYISIMEITSE